MRSKRLGSEDIRNHPRRRRGVFFVFRIAQRDKSFLAINSHQRAPQDQSESQSGFPRQMRGGASPGKKAHRGIDGMSDIPVRAAGHQSSLGRICRQMEAAPAKSKSGPKKQKPSR